MRLWLLLGLCLGSQAASIQINPGCPTGYTGDNCKNPTCSSPSTDVVQHDGMDEPGDTIAHFDSDTCTETFQFSLDNFVTKILYITVTGDQSGNFPTPSLFDPTGYEKDQSGEVFSGTKQVTYYWNIYGSVKGYYTLKVSTERETGCEIIVSGLTALTVDGGFITDPRDDNVQLFDPLEHQGIAQYPRMGSSSYLAFKVQNENYPTLAQSVRIFQEGDVGTKYEVIARYNCAFPHITSTPFNCTQKGTWHAEFSGIDNSGNSWTRLYDFTCEASSVTDLPPTGTPPIIPPADHCYNGGILTPNGTCYCGEFFEGAYCEWKLCMNGGTYNVRTEDCICPKGWTGEYCQHVQCKSRSEDNFYRQQKTIGFVVRSAQSMQAQIAQVAMAAEAISNNTRNIQYYILSVVQNNNVYFTHVYTDPVSFKTAILGITHPPVDTVCSDALLLGVTAIMEKIEFQMFPNSPIFVFSDGVTNDGYATAGYALQQMSAYRPILYFLLSDSANGQCNIDISSEGYQTLLNFAAFSQGLAIKSDITKIAQTTAMLVTTVFNTNVLLQNDLLDCRQAPTYQPFFVDESITDVWISSIGDNLTLTVTYPDLSTRSLIPFFFTGNLHIWLISGAKTGTYMVNFRTGTSLASECSYRVTAQSIYTLFFGASNDMITDKYTMEPVMNAESHIVAKINNVFMPDPIDISAEVTFWVNDINSGRIVLYSSSGLWRDGCAYNLYFGPYVCTVPGLGFYASVYMTDNAGWTILRTITGYCSANLPPAPGEHCQNGGASMANGTCVCPSHFSGDNCEIIHCENAGTPQFGVCSCPPYYTGQFCEITGCNMQNGIVNYSPDLRSLTFMMHDSITMRSVFRTVNDIIPRVVHDIVHQHPQWIMNYQLIRFNDTYSQSLSDSNSTEEFINAINNAYQVNMNHSDYSCSNLDLYRMVFDALRDPNLYHNGILYVFVYGMPRADSDTYDKILTHIMSSEIQLNVVQFSMNPCGQDYTSDGLMALTQASGGTYYLSSGPNAGKVVSSLPTLHSSGLIYERFVDNCADKTFYVPVDANTQSITAYIQGEMTHDPIYTKPDQTVANYLSVNNVWSDIAMDSRMDQIIQACDPGWTLSDGHCFYFGASVSTWEDAKNKCNSLGGNLATVYTAAEQKYLNFAGTAAMFWIGLNDITNYNQWVWDGTGLSLDSTHYTNWANGQPNGNETQRCILDDNLSSPGGWIATDCSQRHYFACSKDTYNTDFEAGDNVARNYIQRGTWAIRVQADGPCSILLRAQSTLQVIPLYTTDVHSDYGGTEPIANVSTNRMIAHVTGLVEGTTNSLEYGHVYSDNGQLLQANTLTPRDPNTCTYNYISTPWQCINNGFQMMLTGVDSFGYSYQRVVPVICLTAPDPGSCENGGVYSTVGHKGFCTCPPEFYGVHCEFIYCEHGYPSAASGICKCNGDWDGQFCNMPKCNRGGVSSPDISTDLRTFVLAIDGSSTDDMAPVLDDIKETLTTLLAGLSNTYKDWFGNYVAVVFRDSGVTGNLNVFSSTIVDTNYTIFASKVDAELKANPYHSKQKSRAIFGGLAQALQHPLIKQNSFAFVLTNSKAEDIRNEAMVLSATARTHTQINFMFIGDTTAPGGGSDYNDPAVSDLYEAAHYSGGSAYQIGTTQVLPTIWQMIAGTYYKSYTIVSHHVQNCGQYTDYIQLGSNSTELMVDIAQGDPTVKVINSDGSTVTPTPIFISKNNLLTEFHQTGVNPGIWSVTMSGSTATCMFNIRAKSDIEVFVAFTQDTGTDGGFHDASSVPFPMGNGQSNAVVAVTKGGSLSYVQMLDIEEHGILWVSPLMKRSGCAYNYISTSTFICDRPSFLMAVDGFDAIGHPFRQLLTYHCQGYIPPTTPSKPTTSPKPTTQSVTLYPPTDISKAKFDMIFVADSSDSFTGAQFEQALSPIRTAFENMDFNNSRILLASYDRAADFHGSNFNSVVDIDTYAFSWIDLILLSHTGQVGNNINDVLDYIVNTTIPATPFRDDVRKVIVFISSIGWDMGGFNDPADNIATLKNMNVEFIPIAYGGQANLMQLSQFSYTCLQNARNTDDFNAISQYLVYNIAKNTVQCN